MSNFKDNFSQQSNWYVKYRPQYPAELYAFLASLTPHHELVWDCGTGNGQAAVGLSAYYDNVIATDPSEQQIKNALPHEKVTYMVEKAEQSSLKDHSADLITAANALHWMDFDAFYKEVARVSKPAGIFAAWSYATPMATAEIDTILTHYHDHTLNDFWQYENRLVEKKYTTLPFPYQEIKCPSFTIRKNLNLQDVIGYLNTWSATQRFINKHHFNPTEQVFEALQKVWPDDGSEKTLHWDLFLKVGRVL